ncbi:serine/threonine-protein kinase [Amycolatopsis sp. cmx-4-68]|uniref:serine/threonine-protein kinase n=1 Tax=Amycolatopsis sp. cmx-4-68 TaxID=2790938 RepID=UPI00397A07E8
MSDADDVTCARFALGEFSATGPRFPDDEPPPGLLAGRYEVGRLIGSGGTARVYRAYDVRLAREVAVKIYDRDAVALDQRRRLREMSIQAGIAHPGVVALLDSGIENGRTYLVMQLVEGENLAERLLGGPMPVAEVTALADGLAEALAHVHALRVVHRDLKPANVFLSADGPLIGDFGIAHALDTTHITGTGVVPGTAAYLAPEQVGGEPAGPPADVYALGLMLLECVTGRREFPGTMVEAAMARLARSPRIPEDLPPSLAHTLSRMTQREPDARPTAAEVRQLLHTPAPTLPSAALGRVGEHDPTEHGTVAAGEPHRTRTGRQRLSAARTDDTSELHSPEAAGDAAGRPRIFGAAASDTSELHLAEAAGDAAGRRRIFGAASGTQHRAEAAGHRSGRRKVLLAAGLSTASSPAQRRRATTAAGLTAAAVAAVSAMLLVAQEPGTSSPAQPPAPKSSSSATSSPPVAASGSPAPQPRATESASLEPAAVTRDSRPEPPKATKPGKPTNPETHGKGKGKGLGHDS